MGCIFFSRGSCQPRDQTHVSCIGRQILYHWDTREANVWNRHITLNWPVSKLSIILKIIINSIMSTCIHNTFLCMSYYLFRMKVRIGPARKFHPKHLYVKKWISYLYIWISTQIFHLADCEHYSMSLNIHWKHDFSLVAIC